MGSRFGKSKTDLKGHNLSYSKRNAGEGRLTDAVIGKLVIYYVNATI